MTFTTPHVKPLAYVFTACLLMCSVMNVQAAKVAGITVDDTLTVGDAQLVLNGAGLRKRLFLKLYVSALYLPAMSNDGPAIASADESMAIRIHIRSDLVTRKKLISALKDGFIKSTGGNTAPIGDEIDALVELLKDPVKAGDVYTMAYEPGVGLRVSNATGEVGVVEGLPFKEALFGIWISANPVQASLKKAMLGG